MLAVSLGTHMARLCFGSFEHPRAGAFRRVFNARRRLREVPTVVPRCSKKVPTRVPSHLPATARYCTERAQKSVATISDPFGACAIEAIETQRLRKAEGAGPEPATPCGAPHFQSGDNFPQNVQLLRRLSRKLIGHPPIERDSHKTLEFSARRLCVKKRLGICRSPCGGRHQCVV
jgi:hypothetical protein